MLGKCSTAEPYCTKYSTANEGLSFLPTTFKALDKCQQVSIHHTGENDSKLQDHPAFQW